MESACHSFHSTSHRHLHKINNTVHSPKDVCLFILIMQQLMTEKMYDEKPPPLSQARRTSSYNSRVTSI